MLLCVFTQQQDIRQLSMLAYVHSMQRSCSQACKACALSVCMYVRPTPLLPPVHTCAHTHTTAVAQWASKQKEVVWVQKAPRRVSPKIKDTRKRTAKISRTQKLRRLVRGLVTYRHAHERPKRPTREILAPPRTARPQRTAAVNMSAAEAREKIKAALSKRRVQGQRSPNNAVRNRKGHTDQGKGAGPQMRNRGATLTAFSGLDLAGGGTLHDHGFMGHGQIVGIIDSGLDYDGCFFHDERPSAYMQTCAYQSEEDCAPMPETLQHRKVIAYRTFEGAQEGDEPGLLVT
jgi:hypothetical protein